MKSSRIRVFRELVGRFSALVVLTVLLAQVGAVANATAAPTVGSLVVPASESGPVHGWEATAGAMPAATPTLPAYAGHLQAIESILRSHGVPATAVHLPDLMAARPGRSGTVEPTYTTGPAPMGVSDLGLRNESGTLVPYVYNTSSVRGSVTLTKAQAVYLDGDGPDTFGIQLNAVATNVTLLGTGGFQFWTQNFVSYTSSTENLSFGDNVWNFSSSAAAMSPNALASYGPDGTLLSPILYYAIGPTFQVAYPFTLDLYLNASKIGSEPAVYFNYSISATNGSWAGSFDYVAFNAEPSVGAVLVPAPAFQVNGTGVDPLGLPNDFELVLVGDGDGDTTTFFSMEATISLSFWNATPKRYAVVPAAFDAGSDTGETSNGILPVYATTVLGGPPTLTVGPGPSYVEGLWNVSTALDGSRQFVLTQRPQNAFLFVSPGTEFNNSTAQWVPTLRLGSSTTTFAIPNTGAFQMQWMLSDRDLLNLSVTDLLPFPDSSTPVTANLTVNASMGSYTPLLAWGNDEVGAISQAGLGTAASPFVLIHHDIGPLSPVFGQMNDYGFPVFAAVLLADTTDYVHVLATPGGIVYGNWTESERQFNDLPASNSLQEEFWNVSHVVVTNSSDLTGWLPASAGFIPAGEVLFWGSNSSLVASNTFRDQGVAIALYGGTNNTVWGNTILPGATGPSFFFGNNTTGLLEWESGDLVYNNYFSVDQEALTPTVNAVSCQNVCTKATYTDTWNVNLEPANANATVVGVDLTGSIVHTWYQGGNFWSNYGSASDPFGVLPYNDSGLITVHGDYVPLYPSTLYTVTFVETGLSAGLAWNETSLGVTTAATTPTLTISAPNGTYAYSVAGPAGYVAPLPGTFVVSGTNLSIPLAFLELFPQSVDASGLVSGWTWNVTFNGTAGVGALNVSANTTATTNTVGLTNGTYTYTFSAYGYNAHPATGSLTVAGPTTVLDVHFSLVAVLTVHASGLAPGAPWSVTVAQGHHQATLIEVGNGTIVFTVLELNPGPFTWTVSATNYTVSQSTGSGTAPTPVSSTVTFTAVPPLPGPPAAFDWLPIALGVLAALAALGFVLFAWERRRPRAPPPTAAPAAAAAATPAAPTGPAPWEETPAAGPTGTTGPAPWEESDSDAERSPPYTRSR